MKLIQKKQNRLNKRLEVEIKKKLRNSIGTAKTTTKSIMKIII